MGELDGNTINVKGWNGDIAQLGSDKDLVIKFEAGTKLNAFKSNAAGTPIYDPVDMITVYHPGEPLNVPKRPVNDLDKRRFRAQWEAFKEGKEERIEGTPLSVLFPGNPEIIKTLEAIHIRTVQQLAGISDTGTQNMMFGFNLREKAQKYLAVTEKSVEFHKIEQALADRDAQIRELTEGMAALKAQLAVQPVAQQAAQPPVDMAAITQLIQATVAAAAKPKYARRPYKSRKPKDEPASEPQQTQGD